MSVAKINPFHIKMLIFTLRCYITHESLREVGRRLPQAQDGPVLAMLSAMGFSDGQFSRKLGTKKLYITP